MANRIKPIFGYVSRESGNDGMLVYHTFRLHVDEEVGVKDLGKIGFGCPRQVGDKWVMETMGEPEIGRMYEREFLIRKGPNNTLDIREGALFMRTRAGDRDSFATSLAMFFEK